jgi:hypothetical protein
VAPIYDLPTPTDTPHRGSIGIKTYAILLYIWGRRRGCIAGTDPPRAAETTRLVGGYQYVVPLPDLKTKLTPAVGTTLRYICPIAPDSVTLNTPMIDI